MRRGEAANTQTLGRFHVFRASVLRVLRVSLRPARDHLKSRSDMAKAHAALTSDEFTTDEVRPRDLQLDAKNPRLAALAGGTEQDDLLTALWKHGGLDELALSIAENGYFDSEPLFVVTEGGKDIVVEGNRRLATVKLLLDPELRERLKATDLPKLSAAARKSVEELPIIRYRNRERLWPFIGFRHVNGPRVWDSWSKAQYIAQVRNEYGVSLDEIALKIGDKYQTVQRLYRGLMVLQQAKKAGFDVEKRSKRRLPFSHLYTALEYSGFQKYLGLDPDRSDKTDPVPKKNLENLREVMIWLFGDQTAGQTPVIQSQNPDLKRLDGVLRAPRALHALRAGLGLDVAFQLTKGEAPALKEFLTRGRYQLQQAMGLMPEAFDGQKDIVELVEAIYKLAGIMNDFAHADDTATKKKR